MGDRQPSRADGDLCGSTSISEPFRCVTMAWTPCDLRHWSVIAAGSTSKSRIRRGPMMHGTVGSINGCGRRLHDRLGERRPVPRVLAAVGFFLLIFGSTSIGMGSAIVLSGAIFLGRVGLRGTRWTLLFTTMTATWKSTREGPVADGLC